MIDSAFVKLNVFPPGQRDFFQLPDHPHRFYLEVLPDFAVVDGEPSSAAPGSSSPESSLHAPASRAPATIRPIRIRIARMKPDLARYPKHPRCCEPRVRTPQLRA